MADRVKTVRELKLVASFDDGDDRTVTQNDPRNGLTKADILDPDFVASSKTALIGDKTGAQMVGWKSAKVYESTIVYLDITP